MKSYGVGKHQLNARQSLRGSRSMAPKSTQRIHGERRSGYNGASQPILGIIQAVNVDLRFCVESNFLTYDAPLFMARRSSVPIWCRVQTPQAGLEICSRSFISISRPLSLQQVSSTEFYTKRRRPTIPLELGMCLGRFSRLGNATFTPNTKVELVTKIYDLVQRLLAPMELGYLVTQHDFPSGPDGIHST